jgi:hypothetical protein
MLNYAANFVIFYQTVYEYFMWHTFDKILDVLLFIAMGIPIYIDDIYPATKGVFSSKKMQNANYFGMLKCKMSKFPE